MAKTQTPEHKVLIDVPMPIKTPRLVLRPPQQGDGAALHEAKMESLEDLKKWMPWAHKPHSVEADEAMCREKQAAYILREDLMLFAFDGDKLVASTGIHRFDWELRSFEIGYWVRSSETGKGYATEITTALAHYAFKALNANRVFIMHDDANKASGAVIKKVGFNYEGLAPSSALGVDGQPVNIKHYAFTNPKDVPTLSVSW